LNNLFSISTVFLVLAAAFIIAGSFLVGVVLGSVALFLELWVLYLVSSADEE
jgi:hypothetical protein